MAQPNDPKDFEFNTWVESPLTNRNSSIPLNSPSGNLTVNRYGAFTVDFKQPHHLSNQELFTYLTGAISAGVAVNGVVLLVPAWKRTKNQRTHLKECIDMIGNDKDKSQKNAIENKILGYYVDGKLSEDHRQLLKDKISEYYDSVKGENSTCDRNSIFYHTTERHPKCYISFWPEIQAFKFKLAIKYSKSDCAEKWARQYISNSGLHQINNRPVLEHIRRR